MLKVQNVTYQCHGRTLLENVSVVFEAGKLNLIIGPNGAGKSTLIKIVSNQISPQRGNVWYGDRPIRTFPISELARVRAVLSQNVELPFPIKVRDVVMMGRYPHFMGRPGPKDELACEEAMRFLDVWEMAQRNYLTLSGGEKQRVQFAKVLAQIWFPVAEGCRYLILDEPLTFLDVHYQFDFIRKLLHLLADKRLLVLMVVHDLNLAARFADKIILLNRGRLLACGTRDQVLTREHVKRAYHVVPVVHQAGEEVHMFFEPEDAGEVDAEVASRMGPLGAAAPTSRGLAVANR